VPGDANCSPEDSCSNNANISIVLFELLEAVVESVDNRNESQKVTVPLIELHALAFEKIVLTSFQPTMLKKDSFLLQTPGARITLHGVMMRDPRLPDNWFRRIKKRSYGSFYVELYNRLLSSTSSVSFIFLCIK